MISGKYHLKTHFFLFSLSVKISDYHPFLKNGCLIENKMHGASTQLGPVSHKCKLVGARVFPGRHVYGAAISNCMQYRQALFRSPSLAKCKKVLVER